MCGGVHDVITGNKFHQNRSRGFRGVQKSDTPIDLACRPYNSSALPCWLWFCWWRLDSCVNKLFVDIRIVWIIVEVIPQPHSLVWTSAVNVVDTFYNVYCSKLHCRCVAAMKSWYSGSVIVKVTKSVQNFLQHLSWNFSSFELHCVVCLFHFWAPMKSDSS